MDVKQGEFCGSILAARRLRPLGKSVINNKDPIAVLQQESCGEQGRGLFRSARYRDLGRD
jgi:hypothetical protein